MNEVESALKELDDNSAKFTALFDGLSEEELNRRTDGSSWSIAQHIQHVTRAGRQFGLAMKVAITDARKRGLLSKGPFRPDFIGRLFLKALEPPVKLRVKSPKPAIPDELVAVETLNADFMKMRKKLKEVYLESAGIDLERLKMRHPLNRLLNFNFAVWLALVPSHERRHLWHIDNTIRNLGLALDKSEQRGQSDVTITTEST